MEASQAEHSAGMVRLQDNRRCGSCRRKKKGGVKKQTAFGHSRSAQNVSGEEEMNKGGNSFFSKGLLMKGYTLTCSKRAGRVSRVAWNDKDQSNDCNSPIKGVTRREIVNCSF